MTDAIRSIRPQTPSVDPEPTAAATATTRAAGTHSPAAQRTQRSPARAHDDFGTSPPRDRRLDRALGTSRTATPAEAAIQQRIGLDARRLGNLGAIVTRMQSLPMGPSMEAHRHDVPYAPPLDAAIREQQGAVFGREVPADLLKHGGAEVAIHAVEHGAAHFGAEGLATTAGAVGAGVSVVGAGLMPAQFALHALHAGDERAEAAVARQVWENHQGHVDGQIAQSRADGRDAMRAADVANTSEPVTIDWNRFQTDGDYAQSALTEAQSQMRATQARMQNDRSQLSSAQQLSPQVQALFPWLVGGANTQ